jgi:hypothetical protein
MSVDGLKIQNTFVTDPFLRDDRVACFIMTEHDRVSQIHDR